MPRSEFGVMNAAELLDRVFDVYKKSFIKQLTFSAAIGSASFFLMFLIAIGAGIVAAAPFALLVEINPNYFIAVVLIAVASILPVFLIWSAASDAGHIILSKQAYCGFQVRLPLKNFPRIVLGAISVMLAQFVLSIPWLLAVAAAVYFFVAGSVEINLFFDPYSLAGFLSAGSFVIFTILAALAYVAYSNIFALAIPAAIFERRFFFAPIKRSWQLMKGSFWKILGLRMLWSVTVYLLSYSLQGLWGVVSALINSFSSGQSGISMYAAVLGNVFQSAAVILIGFAVGPLGGILTALLYFNQRIKKEGMAVELTLEKLSGSAAQ